MLHVLKTQIPLLIIYAILAVIPLLLPKSFTLHYDLNYDYHALFILCTLFGYVTIRFIISRVTDWRQEWKKILPYALIALAGTTILFINTETRFRVLSDETNLIGMSEGMFLFHESRKCDQGEYVLDTPNCLLKTQGHRGHLFPFLIYIVHTALGYSINNAFVTNFIISFFILFIGMRIFHCLGYGFPVSAMWALVLISFPIYGQSVTSAGIEPTHILFLVLSIYSMLIFLRSPGRISLLFMMLNFAMFSCARNESLIFVFPAVPLVFYNYLKLRLKTGKTWPEVYLLPIAFYPGVLHNLGVQKVLYQAKTDVLFSVQHLIHNSIRNIQFLANHTGLNESGSILFALAMGGIVFYLYRLFRKRIPRESAIFTGTAFGMFLVAWILYSSYFAGDFNIKVTMRYSLSFVFGMSFLITYFLNSVLKKSQVLMSIAPLFLFLFYSPTTSNEISYKTIFFTKELKTVYSFLDNYKNKKLLVIYSKPHMIYLRKNSSFTYAVALRYWKNIERVIAAKKYDYIFIITGYECVDESVNLNKSDKIREDQQQKVCKYMVRKLSKRLRLVDRRFMDNNYYLSFYQLVQ